MVPLSRSLALEWRGEGKEEGGRKEGEEGKKGKEGKERGTVK